MTVPRRQFLTRTAAIASGALALANTPCSADEAPRPQRIKICQIGVSHAHANKLGVYRKSDDYEVVGVVEPSAELRRRAELTPAFQGVTWPTREKLLITPGLQVVLVETPIRDLLSNARVCVDAGLHVHIDKPAGESLVDLQLILEIASQKQLLVQMGSMFRYNPGVVLLREFLKNGWLGEVFEVHSVMSKVVGAEDRRELAEYPGGSMFELGCHVLDMVIGILGPPQRGQHFPDTRRRVRMPCSTTCWPFWNTRARQPRFDPASSKSAVPNADTSPFAALRGRSISSLSISPQPV